MTIFNKSFTRIFLMAVILMTSQSAIAHTQWFKPSLFNTALNGKTVWVSGQLSISEYAFTTERALSGTVTVTLPDNSQIVLAELHTGKTSSIFDFELTQGGTYKIETLNGPSIRMPRKPKQGTETKPRPITKSVSLLTSYITADAPSNEAVKAHEQWLDIVPVTHPADIVEGEPARFKLTYQGKSLAGQTLVLVPSGGEYQNQSQEQEYTSNAQGEIELTLNTAGVYLLKARYQFDLENDPKAQIMRCSAGLTFEVQLN